MYQAPLRRSEFADEFAYARAMRAWGPDCHEGIDAFIDLAGPDGALLNGVWGTPDERRAELHVAWREAAMRRPHVFVERLPARVHRRDVDVNGAQSLLGADEVGSLLSALAFAWERGWWLDTSLTLDLALLGHGEPSAAWSCLARFKKLVAQYARDNGFHPAFVGVVESGATVGLHAHFALHVPPKHRTRFRKWCDRFARGEAEVAGMTFDCRALALSRHATERPLLHYWLPTYAMKGMNPDEIVQVAARSMDGCDVLLRDVLPFDFASPGFVPFDRIVVGPAISPRARGSWRSLWEQGCRDVRLLYPAVFVDFVRRHFKPPKLPDSALAAALRDCVTKLLSLVPLADRSMASDDAYTAVAVILETLASGLWGAVEDLRSWDEQPYGEVKDYAWRVLRRSARTALRQCAAHGADLCEVVAQDVGPLQARRCLVEGMLAAEEISRELAMRVGEDCAPPAWRAMADALIPSWIDLK